MKKALLVLAMVLGTTAAQAEIYKGYWVIDMSGKHFKDSDFNKMDDGIDGGDEGLTGFALKLDGRYQKDFEIQSKGSEANVQCSVKKLAASNDQTLMIINADVETDSGETCAFTIIYSNGHHATLTVGEEGT